MRNVVLAILERARWAPSGDNEQPWAFECVGEDHVVVHGYDTRHECVYDLDGSASQIALGALIETIGLAASVEGLAIEAERRPDSPVEAPLFDVRFVRHPTIAAADPIAALIESRSVHRRALSVQALDAAQKAQMASAVGPRFGIVWREGASERRRMASLLFASARIRLVMPEAYLVHRDAIEWRARFSSERVPEAAVGLDPITAGLMRWVMGSWGRVQFFNRYLAGTWIPRLQLDVVPALACGGHFFLVAESEPDGIDAYVAAGRAVQRLWLTATSLGLQLQPEVTPLIFARYSRHGIAFSKAPGMSEAAARIERRLARELSEDVLPRAVFMGRVGAGAAAGTRSLRRPLAELMLDASAERKRQKLRRSST